jgi:hypothetical protein
MNRFPRLRMVIAVSPRFKLLERNIELRTQIDALIQGGRIDLAMQLPNPPLLPLIMDSNSARESLPAGSALPNPPYAYPDDDRAGRAREGRLLQDLEDFRRVLVPYGDEPRVRWQLESGLFLTFARSAIRGEASLRTAGRSDAMLTEATTHGGPALG